MAKVPDHPNTTAPFITLSGGWLILYDGLAIVEILVGQYALQFLHMKNQDSQMLFGLALISVPLMISLLAFES